MSLERLGRQLRAEQDALRARSPDRAQVRAELAAMPLPAPRGPSRASRVALGAGAVAAAAAALFALLAPGPWLARLGLAGGRDASRPIAAVLEAAGHARERGLEAGAFVEAPAHEALGVRFSDGTRVQLAAHARARLVELSERGAHLLLESGQLRLAVVPKARARWRVSAGPFLVRVTGTRFDLRWDPEQDQLELDLTNGQVEVAGCVFGQGYRMHAGQRMRASCRRGQFDVTEMRAPGDPVAKVEPAKVEPAQEPAAAADEPGAEQARASERAPRASGEGAPGAGSEQAFAQRCATASEAQLEQLAEQARRARAFAREQLALSALRRRFPDSERASLAAFALGRLAFDARGEYRKAAQWFATYLKEQPDGPLAREARGRLLEATLAAGDRTRARALAQAYLQQHPDGPHAALARSLAGSPGR